MADKIYINSRFCYREDTFDNWQRANPVLLKGEISLVRDGADGKFVKIGDGNTPWNELPFAPLPKGEKGDNGKDYVLTPEDIENIANLAKPIPDQTYSPTSENAQSGKAVAEAIGSKSDKEEWERIANIALTEDAVVYITTDMNGNAFSLKKFRIILFHEAKADSTGSDPLWLSATTPNKNVYDLVAQTSGYAKNVQSRHRLDGELQYYWDVRGFSAQGHYTTANFGYTDITCVYGCRPEFMEYREPINKMRLNYGINGSINAGSKIEIWGVRA